MKKITLNKKLILLIFSIVFNYTNAQLFIDKDFHIADNGVMFVNGVQVQFSATSNTTSTTRTALVYGKLWMDATASLATIGTTSPFPTNTHFIDGYVSSNRAAQFLYPVGQSGTLGIAATIGSNTNTIDVAYRRSAANTASTTPNFASPLTASSISGVEFWHIIGTSPARISLTYDSTRSNFTTLGITDVSQIGIAGLKKSNNTWELIPATIGNGTNSNSILTGTSVLASGSVTTDSNVNLADYSFFTLAKEGCFTLPVSTGTTIWNGSAWSAGAPTETLTAQIDAAYSGPSFTCNSLILNAPINLIGGNDIDCVGNVTHNNFVITMGRNSNFLQRTTGATAPLIKLTVTIPNKRLQDWTYFSSPITDLEITAMASAKAVGGSLSNAYGSHKVWNPGVSNVNTNWVTATDGNVIPGRGFISRVRQQIPFISPVTLADIEVTFEGTSNNQDITLVTSSTNVNDNMSTVLVGNPYPSAISADDFIKNNPNITGELYFWSSKTPATTASGTGFVTASDFATYTLAGGTGTSASSTGSAIPNGFIAPGQGFNVRTAVINSNIFYNNCMRRFIPSTDPIFYRNGSNTSSNTNVDRFWISISNSAESFYNESLIAYIPETTLAYDRMYDGKSTSTLPNTLCTLLNNEKYSIQARSEFSSSDIVPLSVTKDANNNDNMIIDLKTKEGIFNNDDTIIFLHDSQLGIYHNLEVSAYNFTMNELENSTRFSIVYQSSTLENPNFNVNNVNITLFDNNFKVFSKEMIDTISIYDISGRIVETFKNINNTKFDNIFNHEDGIYLAKVTLLNGTVSTQKLTNLNK